MTDVIKLVIGIFKNNTLRVLPETSKRSAIFGEFLVFRRLRFLIRVGDKSAKVFGVKRRQSNLNVKFDLSVKVNALIIKSHQEFDAV